MPYHIHFVYEHSNWHHSENLDQDVCSYVTIQLCYHFYHILHLDETYIY